MAKTTTIQSNFSSGELSPRIALGRMDVAKYANGSRRQENIALTIQGGARRRPGTRFIAETKASAPARLIDFVFSRDQSYVIEVGGGYMRFIRDRQAILSGGVPYETSTPFAQGMRREIRYAQKSDTAFFAHESAYPQRLQRFSDAQWVMGNMPFSNAPSSELGSFPVASLTLSSIYPGSHTATASGAVFGVTDVGRALQSGAGRGVVTGYVSPTQVNLQINTPFAALTMADGGWSLTGSPQAFVRADTKEPTGATAQLYISSPVAAKLTLASKAAGATTATSDVPAFGAGDVGRSIYADTGIALITGFTSATQVDVTISEVFLSLSYGSNAWGMTAPDWRVADIGKTVEINGGAYKITGVSGGTATALIVIEASATVAAPPNGWLLTAPTWNPISGYPRAVALGGQRLLYASTFTYPQHLWGSFVGDTLNFAVGVNDDAGFAFELDGARNSPIQHLAPSRRLLALTDLDEMSVNGGNDQKPLGPTNIQKTDESSAGANDVRPVKVGNETLFVQAAGKKIHGIGYRYENDGFNAPDRTIFSEHITASGIVEMAYQKTPDPRLLCIRADGQMAVCAYDIEQDVVGWGRWVTQGAFESVANVPTRTAEDAYVVVSRSVGGVPRRYIEVFDVDVALDSCVVGYAANGADTWAGLSHLEGMTVQVLADGAYMGEFVVSSGQVVLPRTAINTQIGLGYTALIEALQVEINGNGSTIQGNPVSVNEVILRVLDTKAVVLNGQEIDPRRFGADLLDQAPPDFAGDIRTATFTDQIYKTRQVITQPYPLPFHLLNLIRKVSTND